MNQVAVVPQIELFADAADAADVSDAWSQEAINVQADTAGNVPTHWMSTTDRATTPVFETQPLDAATTIDSYLGGGAQGVRVARTESRIASGMPDFFVRRAAFPTRPKGNTTELLAEWEGYVTEIGETTLEARLQGLRGEGVAGETEEATIPLAEIPDVDRQFVTIGSLFRLCVSYEKTRAGEQRRYSSLNFRRLPAYRQHDLDEALLRARARLNALRLA